MDRANVASPFRLATLLWVALVVGLGISNRASYFEVPLLETADAAVNGIMIENARHFTQIHGNYSRFEFNHPGPAFYYVYALGERVLCDLLGVAPSPGNAHLATCMALQSAFFVLAIAIFASWWRWRAWLPLALLAAALHFGPNRGAFVSIWPPDVVLMTSLAFQVASISVACGRLQHLIPMVITGGFLFHGHVAQVIFVGTLGTLALVLNYWRGRRASSDWTWRQWFSAQRAPWIGSAVLVAVFLLPMALDLVLYGLRGNIATIFARFATNSGDSKDPLQSLLYFLSFATPSREQEVLFTTIGPATRALFADHALRLAAWGLVVAGAPLAVLIWRRRFTPLERTFLGTGWLVLACTGGLCVLWGLAQAREMHHFNGVFYYSVYFLALLLALAAVSRAVDRWFHPLLGAVIIVGAAGYLFWARHVSPQVGPGSGLPIQAGVRAALAEDPVPVPRFLVFEHNAWPVAASVALELHREASGFQIAPWWGFMFGARHERSYPELLRGKPAVLWITNPEPDGIALTPQLSLYTRPATIRPDGDEFLLKGGDRGFRFLISGLTFGNSEYAWTNLPRVVFWFATPPASHDVRIVFDAKSAAAGAQGLVPQPAEVTFNGVALGRVEVSERTRVEVRVPAAEWNRASDALLELRFPAAFPQRIPGRPAYEGWGAWGLWGIRFEPAR